MQHFTFSDSDLVIIRQRRGEGNRLGFAAQLCYASGDSFFTGIKAALIQFR